MALKNLLLLSLLVVAMAIPQAKAQLGILNSLLGSATIQGTVLCMLKANMDEHSAATPAFSNAQVQLLCGGKAFSNATTNGVGKFSIMMDPLLYDLSSLLNGCSLVVRTPLSDCNSKLPSVGALISTLRFLGISGGGIANITPSGFQFVPTT